MRTTNGGATWTEAYIYPTADWSVGSGRPARRAWTRPILIGTTGYSDEPGRLANFMRIVDGLNFYAEIAMTRASSWSVGLLMPDARRRAIRLPSKLAFRTVNNGDNWVRRAFAGGPLLWRLVHRQQHLLDGGRQPTAARRRRIQIYRSGDGGFNWQQASVSALDRQSSTALQHPDGGLAARLRGGLRQRA